MCKEGKSTKKTLIIISLFLLTLCCCTNSNYGISTRETVQAAVAKEMAMEFKNKYGLRPGGFGGSQEKGKTKDITLIFHSYELPFTKEESRRQIITIEEEGLNFLNQQKQLIPFLVDYPLTEANLNFLIRYYLPNRDPVYMPYISAASCYDSEIGFTIDVPNQHASFSDEYEPYEEALKIVLEEKVEPGARWQLSSELKEQIRQRLAAKAQVKPETRGQDYTVASPLLSSNTLETGRFMYG